MKQQKLQFRFHNPNTAEAAADFLVKLLLEANEKKLERTLREAQAKEGLPPEDREG